jgi:hypothetical protein
MARYLKHLLTLLSPAIDLIKGLFAPAPRSDANRVCVVGGRNHNISCVVNLHTQLVAFFRVHPLAESNPTNRTEARQHTPAREALAWLEDPQPPPPPATLKQQIARDIAEAIGWPVADVEEALIALHDIGPINHEVQGNDDADDTEREPE